MLWVKTPFYYDFKGIYFLSGAFSRSLVSQLAPKSQQSELFTFYELSQDGTINWIGPLIIGALTQSLGSEAYVRVVVIVVSTPFIFILKIVIHFQCFVEIGIGLPFLLMVDLKRGEALRQQVEAMESPVSQRNEAEISPE